MGLQNLNFGRMGTRQHLPATVWTPGNVCLQYHEPLGALASAGIPGEGGSECEFG